ncbi:MAG: peptidoglycan bridge formation glycyltransferase FemA/FemB family protein [Chloroflexi bacterium]|nr:peptidoglycan bridge formation glycyltransferase FemA/FemB family protein [Chloroflexota bacterium]
MVGFTGRRVMPVSRDGAPLKIRSASAEDQDRWEAVARAGASFLQGWRWGELRRSTGWEPIRLVAERAGQVVGLVQALHRRQAHLASLVYVPRGPVALDGDVLGPLLEALEAEARRRGAWLLRIEPELVAGHPLQEWLESHGYIPSAAHVQLPHTVLVDLRTDEAAILGGFRPTWRRFIRHGGRRGLSIRLGSDIDLASFYALERETARRQGILGRSYSYYVRFWKTYRDHGARLWMAEREGELLSSFIVLEWGSAATYLYGASTRRHSEVHANYALQWAAMRHAKQAGCLTYDLWGTGAPGDAEGREAGLTQFKSGFGPVVSWLGTWDKPLSPLYPVWAAGEHLRSAALRWRAQQPRRREQTAMVEGTTLTVEDVTSVGPEQWDAWLAQSPGGGHWMQSHAWGEFKRCRGWRPVRVALRQGNQVVGTAQIGVYTFPVLGALAYCAKGPWLDWLRPEHVEAFFRGVRRLLLRQRVFALQVEPEALESEDRLKHQLAGLGLQRYWTNHQFKTTMIVDLAPPDSELQRRMSQSARRFIRSAERAGVQVTEETSREVQEAFYQLFVVTSQRDDFFLRPRSYLLSYWQHVIDAGLGRFLVARKDGRFLAGMFLTSFNDKIWYKDGVSTHEGQKLHAPYAVQWAAMQWGKVHGATYYDMVAIPDPEQLENREHPMWGLYDFKRKFGGEVREFLRAYYHPYMPRIAALWQRVEPLYYRVYMKLKRDVYY